MAIGPIHPIGRINSAPPTSVSNGVGGFVSINKLPYDDMTYVKNEVETSAQEYIATRKHRDTLIRLFALSLDFGIDIIPLPAYTPLLSNDPNQKVTIEASFSPPPPQSIDRNPCISLQLSRDNGPSELRATAHGVDPFLQSKVEEFVDHLLSYFNDIQIRRLIVVTTHELGHYMSYREGNHNNPNLRVASQLFNKKLLEQMSSEHKKLIWLEECLAWAYSMKILAQIGFEGTDEFDHVKVESLKAYFSVLKLKELNLDTYLQLLNQPDYKQVIDLISPLLFRDNSTLISECGHFQESHDIHYDLSRGKRIVPV